MMVYHPRATTTGTRAPLPNPPADSGPLQPGNTRYHAETHSDNRRPHAAMKELASTSTRKVSRMVTRFPQMFWFRDPSRAHAWLVRGAPDDPEKTFYVLVQRLRFLHVLTSPAPATPPSSPSTLSARRRNGRSSRMPPLPRGPHSCVVVSLYHPFPSLSNPSNIACFGCHHYPATHYWSFSCASPGRLESSRPRSSVTSLELRAVAVARVETPCSRTAFQLLDEAGAQTRGWGMPFDPRGDGVARRVRTAASRCLTRVRADVTPRLAWNPGPISAPALLNNQTRPLAPPAPPPAPPLPSPTHPPLLIDSDADGIKN